MYQAVFSQCSHFSFSLFSIEYIIHVFVVVLAERTLVFIVLSERFLHFLIEAK